MDVNILKREKNRFPARRVALGAGVLGGVTLALTKGKQVRRMRRDPWGMFDSTLNMISSGMHTAIRRLVPEQYRQEPELAEAVAKFDQGIDALRRFAQSKRYTSPGTIAQERREPVPTP